jgi:hypothetical protein
MVKVVIEYFRTRARDDAHAVVGREKREAIDLDDAIKIGRALALTLNMPQRPDSMVIADADGNTLYASTIDALQMDEGPEHE